MQRLTLRASVTTALNIICLVGTATPQEPLWGGALIAKIDTLAKATLADGLVSGFSIGVRRGDEILLAQGYGFADLENLVPAGPHTVYRIGSLTKQFTAAAIMQLVESGEVNLDDPLTNFFPEYPTHGYQVTVRQLLTHTSGIRSYPSDDTPTESLRLDLSDEELRALIEAEPFDFAPGVAFRYSNAGYVLLGMIIAEVTDQSYAAYIDQRIAEPLGLEHTSVCDTKHLTPRRARGYELEDGQLVNATYLSMTHPGAAGAICSTVFDLLSWNSLLSDGAVVAKSSYEQMVTPATLTDGREVPYGFGLRPQARLEGRFSVSHGGGIFGFSSELDYFPETDLAIAVISNTYGSHVRRMTDAIARWALGIPMPTVLDARRSVKELEVYVGTYHLDTPDQEWVITRRGEWLFLQIDDRPPSRLRSQGDDVFVPQSSDFAQIMFEVEAGRAAELTIHECVPTDQTRCRTREGVRVQESPQEGSHQ